MSKINRQIAGSTSRNSKSQRSFVRSVHAVVEMLENRTLLSATLSGTTLNITGTSAADTFTLSDTGTTITVKQGATTSTFADSSVTKIVVNPTAGGDTFNLQSNTKPITITGGGLDTVNIGNAGSLQQIKGAVTIANPSSFTALNLNGVADISNTDSGGVAHSGTLTASTISLSPGTITYTASQLSALSITTSYILNVTNTGSLHAGAPTIITTGSGDSPDPTVNITATTGALTINGSDNQGNQVDVGMGNTQNIHGTVLVNNDDFTGTVLNIDDSNDTTGRNGSLSGQGPITIAGFSPASILFNEAADGLIIVNAGQGNDTITIGSAPFDEGDIVHGDGGNDNIIVPANYNGPFEMSITGDAGNDTLTYSGSDAIPSFDGGTGTNQVTFDQTTKSNAAVVELHADGTINDNNTDEGSAVAPVASTISQVNVLLGSTNDTVTADAGWNIPLSIHGGAGNDTLNGGSANDSLFGDDGNDSLNGGAGTDVLTGGTGIDSLNAGDGQPQEIIADNIANTPVSGSQGVTVNGNWIASTSTPGFYATNYITDNNSLKGTKNVVFTPNIPTAGTYQVFARWTTGPTRATNVPFSVLHQGTTTTVTENQQLNNNAWVSLGTFALNAGTSSSVTISNTGTNGYVVADAVRFLAVQTISSNVALTGTTLNITGTSGADTTTLSDNGTTISVIFNGSTFNFPDSSVSKISVNPSAGGDTVNLLSNTKPVSITGGGLDTVDIGGGTLQKIAAAVSVDNPTSFTNLTLDGSSDPDTGFAGQNGTLTPSTFSNPSIGVITYNAARLSALAITQGNSITVNDTGVLHNNAPTVIHGISTVLATTGALTIDLTNGGFATIGQGTVQNIKGALIVEQSESTGSELSINDSNDTVGRNVSLDRFLTITGLAPVPIIYQGADDEAELDLSMGSGNDTLTVAGGAFPVTNIDLGGGNDLVNFQFATDETTINGGDGNDTLHIDAGDQLGQFSTFDGGIGTNSVVIDNTAGPFEGPWEIGDNGVGTGLGVMTFANVQAISFLGGSVNNIVDANTSAAVALLIHGGDGDDTINVNSPNATVFGDAGNDTITAGNGNVSINGGDGNDSLTGGTGATLTGGTGIDTLNGGNGQPQEIIADNIANAPVSGSQGVTINGNWIASTSTPGFYATNYITDNNSLKGTKNVVFTPNIPTAGTYQVFARWTTGPTRATNVPFSILHQGTTTTVTENQQLNNNTWVSLGTFALNAGTSSSVTISNTGTNGYVVADAVRFLSVPAAPSNVSLTGTTLNITGTSGADTTTLSDNGTNISVIFNGTTFTFADSAVSKISVNPSTGGDTVNLLSNTKPVSITGGGLDTVNVTNTGSLSGISAAVSIDNPSSFTNLTVDGSADQAGATSGTLSATTLTGLSAGTITYAAARLSAFTINTQDEVTVNDTGVLHNSVATIINGGASIILGTTGPLVFNIVAGNEMFIGNGNMQSIKGQLNINSDPTVGIGLNLNDSTDTVGRNISVSDFVNFTGMSPAPIITTGTDSDSDLLLTAGSGDDTISIDGGVFDDTNFYDLGNGNNTINFLSGGIVTDITAGSGNDALNVGNGAAPDEILDFHGGAGTNTLTVDDSTNVLGGSPFFISNNGVGYSDGGHVDSSSFQKITILGSPTDNLFTVDASTTIPLVIHGNTGNDVIMGGTASDTLYGGGGNDTIFGMGGNDSLFGEAGNDSLNGGQGTDVLTGGTGIDTIDSGDGDGVHIIADDIASQGVTVTGNWISSTSTPGFYATDYLTDNNSLKGTKSVKWAPTIPVAGAYQVYAQWTSGANRATNVPYDIVHQGVTTTVTENQQNNNGTWVLLGTYNFDAGSGASVTVRNTGTNGFVVADAIRFIPVVATASITGTVFNDSNGDGKQEPGEGGTTYFSTVYIDLNKDGVLDNNEPNVQADNGGNWSFTNLAAGTYRIRKVNQAGENRTVPAAGFYDVTITTGAVSSDIYGLIFGDHAVTPVSVPAISVNAGGPDLVLNSGDSFAADNHFTGGTAISTPYDVANTDNDPLYYSFRSGTSFSYSIPVASGNYNLVLWFADPTKTAAGQRVFNVSAQGQQVLTNFDIVATGGAKTPVIKTIPITITQDVLTLSFSAVTDNAIISAFAIYPV